MLPLTKKKGKITLRYNRCYICRKKKLNKKFANGKNHLKRRDQCHYTGKYTAHIICNLRFNVPNEISVVSYNGSNYDC